MYRAVHRCGIVHGDLTGVSAISDAVVPSVTHLIFTVECTYQGQWKSLPDRFWTLANLHGSHGLLLFDIDHPRKRTLGST